MIQGGADGASPTLKSLLQSLKETSQQSFRIEVVRSVESFPRSTALDQEIRKQLERSGNVQPWHVEQALEEVHRRGYFPKASKQQESRSINRWPNVLKVAVEGNAELALSSFGAALFYLQRSLIDAEILSSKFGSPVVLSAPLTQSCSGSSQGLYTSAFVHCDGEEP